MVLLELIKVIFLGIIEGITEWLPISSTGHMLLVDEFIKLNSKPEFKEMFFVVIQLGAILAVIYMYWSRLWPFRIIKDNKVPVIIRKGKKKKDARWKNEIKVGNIGISRAILNMWVKVIVATIPAAVVGLILDDWMEKYAHNGLVISVALMVYGILFILVENRNERRTESKTKFSHLTYKDAVELGLFQALAIVPGTSRSGATIVGGLTMGISRRLATEFSFFMSIPIMFGWSLIKIIKFGMHYSAMEFIELLIGMVVAFLVSVVAIKFLMGYIKKNNFKVFGIYRIVLGLLVMVIFIIKGIIGG